MIFLLFSAFFIFMSLVFRLFVSNKKEVRFFRFLFFISSLLLAIEGAVIYVLGEGVNSSFVYHFLYAGDIEGGNIIALGMMAFFVFLLFLLFLLLLFERVCKSTVKVVFGAKYLSLSLVFLSILTNPVGKEFYQFFVYSEGGTDQLNFGISQKKDKTNQIIDGTNKEDLPDLIFIFAESFERTYLTSDKYYPYVKEINNWEKNSIYFKNIKQLEDSSWTIAGMVSSLCGIPLTHPSGGNTLGKVDEFYPAAICLGDILKDYGYNLSYIQGSSLDFSGIRQFFEQHGFVSVKGKSYFEEKNPGYDMHHWGVYDDTLLDEAYRIFKNDVGLGKTALFISTIDTHFPDGYVSKKCEDNIDTDVSPSILAAISCSSYLISNFIDQIRANSKTKDAIVVVASDHIGMGKQSLSFFNEVQRQNLFFVNLPSSTKGRKGRGIDAIGSQLDIGTTLLHIMGIDGRIGLGVDLLSKNESIAKKDNVEDILRENRGEFLKLWELPKSDNDVVFDKGKVVIGGKKYSIPVLFKFSKDSIVYPYYKDDPSSLLRRIASLDEEDAYLIVDKCLELNYVFDDVFREDGTCYALGRLGVNPEIGEYNSGKRLTKDKFTELYSVKVSGNSYQNDIDKMNAAGVLSSTQRWLLNKVDKDSYVLLDKEIYLPFEKYSQTKKKIEDFYKVKILEHPSYSLDYYSISSNYMISSLEKLYNSRIVATKSNFFDGTSLKSSLKRYGEIFLALFSDKFKYKVYDIVIHHTLKDKSQQRYATGYKTKFLDAERYIAHAGGAIDGITYTNSKDSLDLFYKKGFKLFELDLLETSDGYLVAAHDWNEWKTISNYKGALPPTLDEFKKHLLYGKYEPLSMKDISQWFEIHDDSILVTDKINSPQKVVESFPFKERLIMELFTWDAIIEANKLGVFSAMPSWNFIRNIHGDIDKIKDSGIKHVALSKSDLKNHIGQLLALEEIGVKSYLFNIGFENSKGEEGIICDYLNVVYGLYVDDLDLKKISCE
ncbi:sulfatase-like hydrolase/transferase [Vibrio tetraodonis]|uniref:sulfatase-like hydrolase/transferase n=1 Tax=Vibrio tetraodonis TaxID=2231647 RepID=UPI000E0C6069|nr:sulfatase-like hydrolase/transferase [Vibrio tetraodonis]